MRVHSSYVRSKEKEKPLTEEEAAKMEARNQELKLQYQATETQKAYEEPSPITPPILRTKTSKQQDYANFCREWILENVVDPQFWIFSYKGFKNMISGKSFYEEKKRRAKKAKFAKENK